MSGTVRSKDLECCKIIRWFLIIGYMIRWSLSVLKTNSRRNVCDMLRITRHPTLQLVSNVHNRVFVMLKHKATAKYTTRRHKCVLPVLNTPCFSSKDIPVNIVATFTLAVVLNCCTHLEITFPDWLASSPAWKGNVGSNSRVHSQSKGKHSKDAMR